MAALFIAARLGTAALVTLEKGSKTLRFKRSHVALPGISE
jgi:hypothetical protein